MPPDTVVCRHCEKVFTPQPKKPGYRDECLQCLNEQAEHKKAVDEFLAAYPLELAKRNAKKQGITVEEYFSRLRTIIEQN